MRSITHREFLTRLSYIDSQWSQPNRSDYYMMRVAQRVHQLLLVVRKQNPNNVNLDQQKVEFELRKRKTPEQRQREKIEKAKRVHQTILGWFGIKK